MISCKGYNSVSDSRMSRVGQDNSRSIEQIYVALSGILLSSFDSFDFSGRRLLGSKVERTCKRRETQRGCLKRSASFARYSKGSHSPLACGIACTFPDSFDKANNKGRMARGTPKSNILFSVMAVAINPSLIEPNLYASFWIMEKHCRIGLLASNNSLFQGI